MFLLVYGDRPTEGFIEWIPYYKGRDTVFKKKYSILSNPFSGNPAESGYLLFLGGKYTRGSMRPRLMA